MQTRFWWSTRGRGRAEGSWGGYSTGPLSSHPLLMSGEWVWVCVCGCVGVCGCVKERDCVLAVDRLTVMTKRTLHCFGLVGTKQGIFYACNCSMSYICDTRAPRCLQSLAVEQLYLWHVVPPLVIRHSFEAFSCSFHPRVGDRWLCEAFGGQQIITSCSGCWVWVKMHSDLVAGAPSPL